MLTPKNITNPLVYHSHSAKAWECLPSYSPIYIDDSKSLHTVAEEVFFNTKIHLQDYSIFSDECSIDSYTSFPNILSYLQTLFFIRLILELNISLFCKFRNRIIKF